MEVKCEAQVYEKSCVKGASGCQGGWWVELGVGVSVGYCGSGEVGGGHLFVTSFFTFRSPVSSPFFVAFLTIFSPLTSPLSKVLPETWSTLLSPSLLCLHVVSHFQFLVHRLAFTWCSPCHLIFTVHFFPCCLPFVDPFPHFYLSGLAFVWPFCFPGVVFSTSRNYNFLPFCFFPWHLFPRFGNHLDFTFLFPWYLFSTFRESPSFYLSASLMNFFHVSGITCILPLFPRYLFSRFGNHLHFTFVPKKYYLVSQGRHRTMLYYALSSCIIQRILYHAV